MSKIYAFLFFYKVLLLDKFASADFKYDNNFLKFYSKITQMRDFLCQIKAFLFFQKFLKLDMWQCYLQIPTQDYPNKAFLVPNLRVFIFAINFATRQIQKTDLKYDESVFKFQPKNNQIRHFCSQIYINSQNFAIK